MKLYSCADEIKKYFTLLYGETNDMQLKRYNNLFDRFNRLYGKEQAYVASSSGRVEVCGNHTDHNGGLVISCAISLDTIATFLPTDDNIIKIDSEGYPEITVKVDGDDAVEKGTSSALVKGVMEGFKNRGYKVGGFIAVATSNVAGGAGVSSSASFELLIAEILNCLYNEGKISNEEKAVIAQYSENVYFGKPCGLLDQTAISFGGLNLLDFSNKEKIGVTSIENDLNGYTLVLVNTGGSHADLTDEYASIPAEMFSVAKAFDKDRLIDLSEDEFYDGINNLKVSDRAILRAIHFYEENKRVVNACTALKNNNYDCFLKQVKESGISSLCKLQNCFVEGRSERLIPKALSVLERYLNGGVNRVHGGGFAGSVLNIISNDNLSNFLFNAYKLFGEENVYALKVRSVGAMIL